jgi:hypothetical protein
MLIDGTGRVMDDESGTADLLEVSFRGGVLHRPAPVEPGDQVPC